ncbi:collagen-like protein [Oscillatoria sp. CS-180]|uniref:collagen-like protein n=1 Tax=Oscillatoria sp. CS-180 TaxID=3021720 RepID=UPI00232A8ADB|nr:collagen-like protein [Oscillatoria sp. CS-180]MDB9528721.1 collagen-like protein [Oscillatoria sp. CS-180]
MKFRIFVGLGLSAIALSTTSLVSHHYWPTLVAWADEIRSFGSDGSNGRSGRSGQVGAAGRDQTVWADGRPQQVNAIGGDGGDGESGDPGERPFCRAQPRNVRYNLQAADGGDGGSGGSGGNGGRGGNVTIYYTDPAHLRLIAVDASGGRGGRGGRGGYGGDECNCEDHGWEVQVCQDGNCRNERYVCRDGRSGNTGYDGYDGTSGQPGQLRLINQSTPLLSDAPTQTQPLNAFLQAPVRLSKNRWQSRFGAGAVLASGSIVANEYYEFMGRLEAQAQVVWEAERSQSPFLSFAPTVTLEDSGELQMIFPDSLWIEGRTEQTGELTTYVVTHVVRADEVTNLSWGRQTGRGSDFAITVIDLGQETEFVDTQFKLVYSTSEDDPRDNRRARYRKHFDGIVPAEVITRDNNRFVIALGEMAINDRYFQRGTYARVELQVVRSLGENSAERTLSWEERL